MINNETFESVQESTDTVEARVYNRLPLSLEEGQGCYVTDVTGRRFLDLYGGHAVALTGHCHPKLVEAIQTQASRLLFYSSAVYSSIRARAGEALLRHCPPGYRVFHCCSGTEANENAIKIARLVTKRKTIVSFTASFHGRTLGSLAACGIEKYRKTSGVDLSTDHRIIPFGEVAALEAIDESVAAVLVEPIQSLGGVIMVADDYYRAVAEQAKSVGAKLIFDEIQTGLGRCGSFFFSEGVGVRADISTLAKGLGSGVTTAAVILSGELEAGLAKSDLGTTFGGGPLAMAAIEATIKVIEEEELVNNAKERGAQLCEQLNALDGVVAVHGRGLLLGVEFELPAKPIQQALMGRGIIVGSSSKSHVFRLLPPLVLTKEQVDHFVKTLAEILDTGFETNND